MKGLRVLSPGNETSAEVSVRMVFRQMSRLSVVLLIGCMSLLVACSDTEVERYTLDDAYDNAIEDDVFEEFPRCTGQSDDEPCVDESIQAAFQEAYDELIDGHWQEWVEEQDTIVYPHIFILERDIIEDALFIDDASVVLPWGGNESILEEVNYFDVLVSKHEEMPFLRRVLDIRRDDNMIVIRTVSLEIHEVVQRAKVSIQGDSIGDHGDVDSREQELQDVETRQQPISTNDRSISSINIDSCPNLNVAGSARQFLNRHTWADFSKKDQYEDSPVSGQINARIKRLDAELNFEVRVCQGYRKHEIEWDFPFTSPNQSLMEWIESIGFCGSFAYALFAPAVLPIWSWVWSGATTVFSPSGFLPWSDNRVFDLEYRGGSEWRAAKRRFESQFRSVTNVHEHVERLLGEWQEEISEYSASFSNFAVRAVMEGLARALNYALSEFSSNASRIIPMFEPLVFSPFYAAIYCTGELQSYDIGLGALWQMTVEPKATVEVEAGAGFEASGTMREVEGQDSKLITRVGTWVPLGKLPAYFSAVLTWDFENTLTVEGNVEASLGQKGFRQDWYWGHSWDRRTDHSEWHTLDGGNVTEWLNRPGYIEGNVAFKKEIRTGPKLEFRIYETVGLNFSGGVYAKAEASVGASSRETCHATEASVSLGADFKAGASVGIPGCPEGMKCRIGTSVTLWDTCRCNFIGNMSFDPRAICACPMLNICTDGATINDSIDRNDLFGCWHAGENMCRAQNDTTRSTPPPQPYCDPNTGICYVPHTCPGCNTALEPDVNNPPGVNDVADHLELDAIIVERPRPWGSEQIKIDYVEGLANCTPERDVDGDGCAYLLRHVSFTECDPEQWEEKVALIADLDAFRIRFEKTLQPGDVVRVFRQGVPASQLNEQGERCQASGNFALYLGDGSNELWASEPVGWGIYNSGEYRVEERHLNPVARHEIDQ